MSATTALRRAWLASFWAPRFLDAAFQLFTERGFSETTMDQIAKRAGASTKTLYSRYENKADILAAVVRRLVDSTIASHDEVAALQETERASVLCLSMATDWVRISTSLGDPPSRMEIDAHVAYAVDLFLRGCGYAGQTEAVEAPAESMTAA